MESFKPASAATLNLSRRREHCNPCGLSVPVKIAGTLVTSSPAESATAETAPPKKKRKMGPPKKKKKVGRPKKREIENGRKKYLVVKREEPRARRGTQIVLLLFPPRRRPSNPSIVFQSYLFMYEF